MKLLVIGSTGTLGKNIVNQAINAGFKVKCLVRSFTTLSFLPVKAEFVYGDLSDPRTLPSALKNISIVIDAATTREYDNYSGELVDWKGKVALIQAARLAKIEQFIFFSLFGTARNTNIPLVDLKFEVENLLLKAPFKVNIFQCPGFFQGLVTQFAIPILENETIWLTQSSYGTCIAYIDALDVADIVVQLLKVVLLRKDLLLKTHYTCNNVFNYLSFNMLGLSSLVIIKFFCASSFERLYFLNKHSRQNLVNLRSSNGSIRALYCLRLSFDIVGYLPAIQSCVKNRIKYFFRSISRSILSRYIVRQSKTFLTKPPTSVVQGWFNHSQLCLSKEQNNDVEKHFGKYSVMCNINIFGFLYRYHVSTDSGIQLGVSYRKWIKRRLSSRYVRGTRVSFFIPLCEVYFLKKNELHCWLFTRPKNKVLSLKGNKEWTANQIVTLCERLAAKKAKVFYIPEFVVLALTKFLQVFEGARNISDRLQLLGFNIDTLNVKSYKKPVNGEFRKKNGPVEVSTKLIKIELYSLPRSYSKRELGNKLERVDLELYLQAYFRMIRRKLLEKNYQKLQKKFI